MAHEFVLKPDMHVNVGVVGHVDSGKTSLVRALSTTLSTAALDKHPESKRRGITLDLGFSAFSMKLGEESVDVTLVDCPGHASLLRTIVGGASIVDFALIVIDATKGIQAQTAEAIVVAELVTSDAVVVLNKVDLATPEKIEKTRKAVTKALKRTRFKSAPIVTASAAPDAKPEGAEIENVRNALEGAFRRLLGEKHLGLEGGEGGEIGEEGGKAAGGGGEEEREDGMERVADVFLNDGGFLLAVDHCFSVKGQGTVVTGTVLRGSVRVKDEVEAPLFRDLGRFFVKSIQCFHKSVEEAHKGDRVGLLIPSFPTKMERGVICAPNSVPVTTRALAAIFPIPYHKPHTPSPAHLHVSVAHTTSPAKVTFFAPNYTASAIETTTSSSSPSSSTSPSSSSPPLAFPSPPYLEGKEMAREVWQLALLEFGEGVAVARGSRVVGMKLDGESGGKGCRVVFHGYILTPSPPPISFYKIKTYRGMVERKSGKEVIVRNLIHYPPTPTHPIFKGSVMFVAKRGGKKRDGEASGGGGGEGGEGEREEEEREVVIGRGRVIGGFGKSGKVKLMVTEEEEEGAVKEGAHVKIEVRKEKKGKKKGGGE